MSDNVNHPAHYADSCSLECIDVMEVAFGNDAVFKYCIINAFKYLWRYKNKNGMEDVSKAEWYLNKAKDIYNTHENAYLDDVKMGDMFDLLHKVEKEVRPKKTIGKDFKEEDFNF